MIHSCLVCAWLFSRDRVRLICYAEMQPSFYVLFVKRFKTFRSSEKVTESILLVVKKRQRDGLCAASKSDVFLVRRA